MWVRWSKNEHNNNSRELIKTYTQIFRKTWVDHCTVTFTEWEIYGFLFFHSTVIVNNIYKSKYGGNVRPNKNEFNHKLFHINNLSRNNKDNTNLSAHWLILLQSFDSSTESHTQEAWASTSLSAHSSIFLSFSHLEFCREFCYLLCLTWFTIFFYYL